MGLMCVLALFVGCDAVDREASVPFEPPLLAERDLSSVVTSLQGPYEVPFEHVTGTVPEGFAGVTFTSGVNTLRLSLTAAHPEGRRMALAVYGPRPASGVWGEAVAHVAGATGQLELVVPLESEGRYLALIGTVSGDAAADFDLSIGCVGGECVPPTHGVDPSCPSDAMQGCTLSCALGFVRDEAGCETCACITECVDELECPDGEVCSDGMCVPQCRCTSLFEPVCGADGVTYGNACEASCEGVEVVAQEACAASCPAPACEGECPNGYVVDADGCPTCECQSACASCPKNWAPVCTLNGRTFLNACQAQCAGERVAYLGVCRMSCTVPACDGLECGSLGFAPDAGGCPTCACQEEPKCDGAGRVCATNGATLPSVCAADLAGAGVVWEGTCPGYLCASTAGCPSGTECVAPETGSNCLVEGESCLGVCLRRQACESGVSSSCPPGYECLEGSCQAGCMCSSRYDPVCGSDGVTYDNACVAACAGASIARVGRCCPALEGCTQECPYGRASDANGCAICECRAEPACSCTEVESPVCATAADGSRLTYLNACKASCDGYAEVDDGACAEP